MSIPVRPIAVRVEDAARMIGTSRAGIYRLLAAGQIEARKNGKATLVMVDSLDNFVAGLPRGGFGERGQNNDA